MAKLEDVLLVGDRASQPVATAVSPGTLYAVDDEGFLIEQSDGSTWNQYGPAGSGSTLPAVVQGDTLYGSAAGVISALAKTSSRRSLVNTGTSNNPAWAGAQILVATGTISNANYLLLPTAAQTLVAAPGAGFTNNFLSAYVLADFAGGAYTGAAAVSWLYIASGSTNVSSYIVNDNTITPNLSYLSTFNAGNKHRAFFTHEMETADENAGWGLLTTVQASYTGDNEALVLTCNNGGVNFGGGNAANALKYVVFYSIEATS